MVLILNRILGIPPSIAIDYRPEKKFRQGSTGAPEAAAGSKCKPVLTVCPGGGGELVLHMGRVAVSMIWLRGGLVVCSALGGVECWRHA